MGCCVCEWAVSVPVSCLAHCPFVGFSLEKHPMCNIYPTFEQYLQINFFLFFFFHFLSLHLARRARVREWICVCVCVCVYYNIQKGHISINWGHRRSIVARRCTDQDYTIISPVHFISTPRLIWLTLARPRRRIVYTSAIVLDVRFFAAGAKSNVLIFPCQ